MFVFFFLHFFLFIFLLFFFIVSFFHFFMFVLFSKNISFIIFTFFHFLKKFTSVCALSQCFSPCCFPCTNCSAAWNMWYLFCRLEHVVLVLTPGTCGTAVLVCSFNCRVFLVWLALSFQHNAFALAQESATCNQTDLHRCFQSCLDSCETVGTLDTAHAQSHEHVFVVS